MRLGGGSTAKNLFLYPNLEGMAKESQVEKATDSGAVKNVAPILSGTSLVVSRLGGSYPRRMA
jgi:hypothetical protein